MSLAEKHAVRFMHVCNCTNGKDPFHMSLWEGVPLPRHWWSRGAGGGGAFFSPSLSPLNQGTLYISTDMGTVFHSANGGALWDSYAFGNLQGGRLARMQFTSDPAVLYVLDGRVDYVTYVGGAIFKSVNGGSSWVRLTSDPCIAYDATRKKLRADPARTNHLVLGHDRGLWFSGDGGTSWTAFFSPGSGCYFADVVFDGLDATPAPQAQRFYRVIVASPISGSSL